MKKTIIWLSIAGSFLMVTPLFCGVEDDQPLKKEENFIENKTFGIGPFVGSQVGVSGKWWGGSGVFAAQVAAGYDFSDSKTLSYLDALIHIKNIMTGSFPAKNTLFGYVGGGIQSDFKKWDNIVIRIPVGLDFIFKEPADLYFEAVPALKVEPETKWAIDGTVGIRFYFLSSLPFLGSRLPF